MKNELKFPFAPWRRYEDRRTLNVGTQRAFGVVDNELDFLTDPGDESREQTLNPVAKEVAALMAECIDWFRSEGFTPEQVQSKVNEARTNNLATPKRQQELIARRARIFDASDPTRKGESLSKTQKPREVR